MKEQKVVFDIRIFHPGRAGGARIDGLTFEEIKIICLIIDKYNSNGEISYNVVPHFSEVN